MDPFLVDKNIYSDVNHIEGDNNVISIRVKKVDYDGVVYSNSGKKIHTNNKKLNSQSELTENIDLLENHKEDSKNNRIQDKHEDKIKGDFSYIYHHFNTYFMSEAFVEAEKALSVGEAPIGCVIVDCITNKIISRGYNLTNERHHALAHAEFVAIENLLNKRIDNSNVLERIRDVNNNKIDEKDEKSTLSSKDLMSHTSYSNCRKNFVYQNSLLIPNDKGALCSPLLLSHCVIYVTVEPCIMCAAMLLFRQIGGVFFGAANPRFGGNGSVLAVNASSLTPCKNHQNLTDKVDNTVSIYKDVNNEDKNEINANLVATGIFEANICDDYNKESYPSHGFYSADRAIMLLQKFYLRENKLAPESKRKRKENKFQKTINSNTTEMFL